MPDTKSAAKATTNNRFATLPHQFFVKTFGARVRPSKIPQDRLYKGLEWGAVESVRTMFGHTIYWPKDTLCDGNFNTKLFGKVAIYAYDDSGTAYL